MNLLDAARRVLELHHDTGHSIRAEDDAYEALAAAIAAEASSKAPAKSRAARKPKGA